MRDNVVVILTALNLEYTAVRNHLIDPQLHRHDKGTLFEIGTLRDTDCRVALGLVGKGNQPAAILAERAIHEFSPVAVLFVGVAGALWDTPLGDVVMATQVHAYHGGTSEDDGLKARPRGWELAHSLSQLAAHLARTGTWTNRVPGSTSTPTVHFGAIAAGEVVQNSRISQEAMWIRQHYNDALAIEMEAAGVAQAGHLNGSPVAIVRGISDRADGTKNTDADANWQPRAAANAAAFALQLAEELSTQQEPPTMHQPSEKSGDVYNLASGQVAIQGAHVSGNSVVMNAAQQHASPTDLVTELATFRDQLQRERSAGTVDDDTYEAAHTELDTASKELENNTPESKRRFVLALKRVYGLIADVTGLATKIISLITAAKNLP